MRCRGFCLLRLEIRSYRLELIRGPEHRNAAQHRAGLGGRNVEKADGPIGGSAVALKRAQVDIGFLAGSNQQHGHPRGEISRQPSYPRHESLEILLAEAQAHTCQQGCEGHDLDRDDRVGNDAEAGEQENACHEDQRCDEDRSNQDDVVKYGGILPLALVEPGRRKRHGADRNEHDHQDSERFGRVRIGNEHLRAETEPGREHQRKCAQREIHRV